MTVPWLAGALALSCATTLWGAGKIGDDDVTVVLQAEMESGGGGIDRRSALMSARESAGSSAAWWQSGFVSVNQNWRPYESASGVANDVWRQYQTKRAAAKATGAEQMKLADWCREAGLADQERAHLVRALMTGQLKEPEKLLRRLGYRPVGRWWFTEEDLKTYAEEVQATAKEWKRLQPKLEALAARLEGKPGQRQKALEELRGLTTPATIPVLERTLSQRSEPTALAVVEALADIDSFRASQALARQAIVSSWDSVRNAATVELKTRPWEEFVPMTLSLLYRPVETSLLIGEAQPNILNNPAGGREWRFLFTREGRQTVEVASLRVIDYRYIRINLADPSRSLDVTQRALSEDTARTTLDVLHQHVAAVDDLNDWHEQINQRAGAMLGAVTTLPAVADPKEWWNWWDASTDSQLVGPKQVILVSERFQKIEAPIRKSCLAAGTPVWTEQGFVPIEKIQVGDRVLSKNVETGELAYKPVLHTTRRENAKLTNVTVGDETFAASPGHNFWISGRGWTRTNQLHDGMTAHTVTGTAALTVRDAEKTGDVFNLVVADFHTYFVGRSMILGHDVLSPSPTDALVPGLTSEFAQAK